MHRPIPDRYLPQLLYMMSSVHNETADFNRIHLKTTIRSLIPLIVVIYLILFLSTLITSTILISILIRVHSTSATHKSLHIYLLLNAINDFIKGLIILPLSLIILLIVHWIHGPLFCYTLPMIQDVTFHVTSLTFVIIFSERHRIMTKLTLYQSLPHEAGNLKYIFAWIISIIGILPYTFFIEYIDVSIYFDGPQFENVGICTTNTSAKEYIRILFLCYYITPIAIVLSYHSKINTLITNYGDDHRGSGSILVFNLNHLLLEKGYEKILITIFSIHSICLLPINILRISKHVVIENTDDGPLFDVLFVTFVGVQYFSIPIMSAKLISWLKQIQLYADSKSGDLPMERLDRYSIGQ